MLASNGLGVVLKGLAPSELVQLAQDAERKRWRSAGLPRSPPPGRGWSSSGRNWRTAVIGAFYSKQHIRDVVVPSVRRGAEKAGRVPEEIEIGCVPPSIITRDDSGLALIKGQVVMFCTALRSSPGYADCVTAAGFGDELRTIHELVARGDVDDAVRSAPDAMANALTISGRPENAWERIEAFRAAGLTTIALNPSPPGIYVPLHAVHFPDGVKFPPFSFPAYRQVIADVISLMGEG